MAVRNRGLAALVLFGVLAAIHTWPLALHPATLSRNDNADTMLNEWTIAWVAHALPRDPAHLFDANIFHPERRTLAFSEHLLLPALMVAPVSWLGGSPVLAFNLALLAGLVLTGWLTALVVSRWTDNWGAGVLAGSLFAFNAHTLTRLPHLQAMHLEFLPMAVAALDRVLALGRPRDALATAAWFLMQALCSVYSTVFTAVAFSAALVARLGDWIGRRSRAGRAMGLALGLAAIFSVPILLPYYRVSREQHVVRSLDEAAHYSATWRDYLATAGTLHFNTWSHRFVVYDATALFPGVVALVLAGGALVTGVAVRDRRARACLAIAFVGFILSFGPQTPVYTLAYHAFPLMHAVRAASRFAVLVLFGIAALAGFGLASLLPPIERRSTRGHTLARAVVAAAIVIANLEALRAPITYVPFRGIPRIYEVLRTEPDPVVAAELPMYRAPDIARNARYELHSTRYWKPLVNGYSGIVPAAYEARAEALRGFPNDASREALHAAGVTHVIVHLDAFGELPPALNRVEWLVPLATSRNIRIYRLRSR